MGPRLTGIVAIVIALILTFAILSAHLSAPSLTTVSDHATSAASTKQPSTATNHTAPPPSVVPGATPLVTTPAENDVIASPFTLSGKAPGTWYFEGSFPVVVVDWDGRIIGNGYVTAQGNWMTTDYVPFTGNVTFTADPSAVKHTGTVILKKANPSGLSTNDAAIEIPVRFQ